MQTVKRTKGIGEIKGAEEKEVRQFYCKQMTARKVDQTNLCVCVSVG